MANEMVYSVGFTFQKGNAKEITETFLNLVSTIAASTAIYNELSVTTSEVAVVLGSNTAAKAFIIIHNCDDTNYIEWRTGTGASNDAVYIGPGDVALFRMGTDVTAPYLVANTASCTTEYWIFPD